MSTWRVEQHYGFGAARIPIQPEAHRVVKSGLREGASGLAAELFEGGPGATLRRIAGEGTAIVLGLFIMAAFAMTLLRDHSDRSAIEVVMLETAQTIPDPIVEEPAPLPVEPPKEVVVEKIVPVEPAPVIPKPEVPRPPPMLAERPKPPPPPPVARPKPVARPLPAMPRIAQVEAPKPPPAARPDRPLPLRDAPPAVTRPRVAVALAAPSAPRPAPSAAPERSFRVAVNRPAPGEHARVMPGVAVASAPRIGPRRPIPEPRTSRPATPRPSATAHVPAPELDAPPVPAAPDSAPPPVARRATLAPPLPTSHHTPRPTAALAAAPVITAAAASQEPVRIDRASPTAPRGSQTDRPGVAGVPLGDLASCVNDRDEDRLKQAVVAAVTTQKECVSSKGTYRFIETKNLNAFLMWVHRSPSRPVEDRCGELQYALECLESAGRRAAR